MRTTQYLLATLKEIPKNCESISHQLMLRAGMIRQVSSGLYTWLPTGLRVLKKIENIIHEEMHKIGFLEIFMPITQPANLWKQSGRWSKYGLELLRFKNRTNQKFILGPTHEEMITDLICKEILSYKQLPIKVYQINTKYRDEARPQFGIIRTKEFIMKDGYSFHTHQKSLEVTYYNIYQTYHVIFKRIGLKFRVIQADPGNIGGILSHEFQAYCHNIQNKTKNSTLTSNDNSITINIQKNNPSANNIHIFNIMQSIKFIASNFYSMTVIQLINYYKSITHETIKNFIFYINNKYGNNNYNLYKLTTQTNNYSTLLNIPNTIIPLLMLNIKDIEKNIQIKSILLNYIDSFITSNINYNTETNWTKKLPIITNLCESKSKNIKKIKKNQISQLFPIHNTIEIGHIFQLGEKYSHCINSCIQKNSKYNANIIMGCYGIGVTRIIPMIIEQNHDKNGIIWPDKIAPFKLAIIPINMYRFTNVQNIAEKLYIQLSSSPIIGLDILIDDRKENPGIMFTDIDLIGIPHILIISERNLNNQEVEYKYRKTGIIQKIKLNSILQFLTNKLMNN